MAMLFGHGELPESPTPSPAEPAAEPPATPAPDAAPDPESPAEAAGDAEDDLSQPEATEDDRDAEGDPDDEDEEPSEPQVKPTTMRKMERRIARLTRQLRETQEALKARREEPRPEPPAEPPLPPTPQLQKAQADIERLEDALDWLEQNPGGGSYSAHGKTVEIDADQVPTIRREARKRLRDAETAMTEARLSARQEFEQARSAHLTSALKVYPWINQRDSPELKEGLQLVQRLPWLRQQPDLELLVGDLLAGRKLRLAATKKPAAPPAKPSRMAPAPTAAPSSSGSPAAGASVIGQRAANGEALSDDDVKSYFGAALD